MTLIRLSSFRAALSGLGSVVRSEPHARFHLVVALLVILSGFWLEVSRLEWCWLLASIAAVFAAEALNTGLESLADVTHPGPHPGVGRAKDAAAGAVLVVAVAAALVGVLVLGPHLLARFAA